MIVLHKYVWSGVIVCGLAAGAISVQGAFAQGDGGSGRIGVVNRKTVFDDYEARKTEWSALESEKKQLQTEIDGLRDAVNAAATKLPCRTNSARHWRIRSTVIAAIMKTGGGARRGT